MIVKIQRPLSGDAAFLIYDERRSFSLVVPFEDSEISPTIFVLFFRAAAEAGGESFRFSGTDLNDCPPKIYAELRVDDGTLCLDEEAPLVSGQDW